MKDWIIKQLMSKKFIVVMFSLTLLFVLLMITILKPILNETVINALLLAFGSVFTAYVSANTLADHYMDGKNGKNNNSTTATTPENKPAEENKK